MRFFSFLLGGYLLESTMPNIHRKKVIASAYFGNDFLELVGVKEPSCVKDDKIRLVLAHDTVYVFGTDTAEHLWRRLDFALVHGNNAVDAVYDDANFVTFDVKDYKSSVILFKFIKFGVPCHFLNVKPLVEVDYWDYFTAKVDYSLNIIRCVRNGAYTLDFYDFLNVHNVYAIQFVTKLKSYELKLCIFFGHA